MADPLGVGLIGYGLAGRYFHAPVLAAAGLRLDAVVTSRREAAAQDWPKAAICASVEEMLRDRACEIVVVASPSHLHVAHASAALEAGRHVVVDKPLAATRAEGAALAERAAARGRILAVFQNRRWDADFLTLQRLIAEGAFGEIMRFEAHWDRFRPIPKGGWREETAPASGILHDLGPHLIDQTIALFGRPDWVFADVASQRAGAAVNDGFEILAAKGRLRIALGSHPFAVRSRPRFHVSGTGGAWIKHGLDPQEAQLRAGGRPADVGFGVEAEADWGVFWPADGAAPRATPSEVGRWPAFYENVREAVLGAAALVVTPQHALDTMEIIDACLESAATGRRVALS